MYEALSSHSGIDHEDVDKFEYHEQSHDFFFIIIFQEPGQEKLRFPCKIPIFLLQRTEFSFK